MNRRAPPNWTSLKVIAVAAGAPAAREGWQIGDTVFTVDGVRALADQPPILEDFL